MDALVVILSACWDKWGYHTWSWMRMLGGWKNWIGEAFPAFMGTRPTPRYSNMQGLDAPVRLSSRGRMKMPVSWWSPRGATWHRNYPSSLAQPRRKVPGGLRNSALRM